MGKMWTRLLFVPTRRLFLKFSELQLWDEGVVMITRGSTCLQRRRRCRAGAINELKIEKEIYSIEKCWCRLRAENELELDVVAAMASTRCRVASTSSTWPSESLRVS